MPSSTSSSDVSAESHKYDRHLPERSLRSGAVIAFVVCLALMSGWESYWRAFDVEPSYRNSEGLWAIQRRRVDRGEGNKTAFTGSSRTFFDLQLDVWEAESGERPIQLALEGTSPVSVMEGLAEDQDFNGLLIVGVSPGLFFSGFEFRETAIKRYTEETPTQWLGQKISMPFEPHLRFYFFDFGLFTVIKRQAWPERDGVRTTMEVRKLAIYTADRNARLWSKVENDPEYQQLAKTIWADGFVPIEERDEEWLAKAQENRTKQIDRAAQATKKLQDRGIEVIFINNPYEGHYAISEPMYNPRESTWDVLLERTGALGIHWEDHEELQGYWLPEWSHLSGSEADRYTKALYHLMQRERVRHKEQNGN